MKASIVSRLILCVLLLTGQIYPAFAHGRTDTKDPMVVHEYPPPVIGHKVKVIYRINSSGDNSRPGRKRSEKGELLAISDDYIYLAQKRNSVSQSLSKSPRRVAPSAFITFKEKYYKIPVDEIIMIQMDKHSTSGGDILAMTCGGMVLSLSNGFLLLITVPLWFLTGVIAAISTAGSNHFEFEKTELSELNKYARYPQGIPEEIKVAAVLL